MFVSHLGLYLAACLAAASTGMIFAPGPWYDGLNKPRWTPPRLSFPVVWTFLYIVIAIAAARVADLPQNGMALGLWSVQIALNTLWTPVFFGGHRKGAGLIIIGLLWLTVLTMVPVFWALDRIAGLLIVPYFLWLSVATSLNFWIWRHNRN